MVLNRTLAWEVLCLMAMGHLVEVTHLMEVPCLKKYHILWKLPRDEKSISIKEFSKLHLKNEVVIEWYCIF